MSTPLTTQSLLTSTLLAIATVTAGAQDSLSSRITAAMSDPSAERAMIEQSIAVAPRVHVFHAAMSAGPSPLANETLIEQSDGLVLVDAGKTRGAGERIVSLIRGISPKPVKAVIITHWHQDHVLGLGPIVEAWPDAKIVATRATDRHLRTEDSYASTPRAHAPTAAHDAARAATLRGYADQTWPQMNDTTLSAEERRGWKEIVGVLNLRTADERGTYLVLPSVTFDDRYVIDDADAPVEARFVGAAHTDGDAIVWMPRQRVVAAGDLVVAHIPFGADSVLQWPATLRNLRALSPAVIVPGHGDVQTDTRYVDLVIAALDSTRARAARLIDGGASLSEQVVQSRVDLSDFRRRFAGDDRWLAYWFDQYFAPNAVQAYNELRKR